MNETSEKRPLRVAQLIGYMNGGGVESVIMNYFRHMDRDKVIFDFIVFEGSSHVPEAEIAALGGKVFYIPSYKHIFASKKAFVKILKEGGYDIVHSNLNAMSVFYLSSAKKAGVKVRIAHSHSTSNKKEHLRNILKNILRRSSRKYATHYFACSEYAGRWLFGDKAFDAGLVTIINNAIDLEKFRYNEEKRSEIRRSCGLDDNFIIGHVGRFMPQKNHAFLIDIFAEVCKKRDDARLLLLGDGPLMEDVQSKVSSLGLKDKVIFIGNVPNVNEYYSAMDRFVLPSLYEGLGMVLIEAQANGLKCLASDTVPQAASWDNGVKFIPLDSGSFAWADEILSADLFRRDNNIDTMLGSIYDISAEAKKLEDIYINIMDEKQ